jgi:hypothetical protein
MFREARADGTAPPPRREEGAPLEAAPECLQSGDHHLGQNTKIRLFSFFDFCTRFSSVKV